MTSFGNDVRYALRTLRQSPVFTAVAIGSLALGIGANTAIFSFVDAILLRWLPVQNPQELVVLGRNPARPMTSFSYPDYRYVRDNAKSYAGLIAFSNGGRPTGMSLPGGSGPSQLVSLSMVSGDFFQVLGVQPAAGRVFNRADNEKEGAHPYAVLSHSFWQRGFGADAGVVGRDVLLNGARFQIIGVANAGFTGPSVGVNPDIYIPIVMYRSFQPTALWWNTRHMWWLTVIGRLKPGTSMGQAEAEWSVIWKQILDNDPEKRPVASWDTEYKAANTTVVLPGSRGWSWMRRDAERPLLILFITTGLVLLIACANVANLLLARGVARAREIAVRLAIGAGRGRLIVQMLTESLTLALLGGLFGLGFAWVGVRVLMTLMPHDRNSQIAVSPDLRLLAFAIGLSTLTGVLFGLVPAIRISRPDLANALKAGSSSGTASRGHRWDLRRTLVAGQVALSLLLLSGSALFVRTLANLRAIDPGLNPDNLLFVETNLGQLGYEPQHERAFEERLIARLHKVPGVRAASLAAIIPLGGSRWNGDVQIEGYRWRPDERPFVDMNSIYPRYFEAAGIAILLGRDFQESDNAPVLPDRPKTAPAPGAERPETPGPPRVVIVNEAFAHRFFKGQSAVGRRLCLSDKWDAAKTQEIVGVVRDARYFEPKKPVEPMIYTPRFRESGWGGSVICVRATSDPNLLVNEVRRSAQAIDGSVALVDTRTMQDNLDRNLIQERFVATLGGFFGVVALLLAALGLYGVMAQAVTRRTREIGIRMALGAEARKVMRLVLRDALVMVAVGAGIGIPAVLAATRYTESMLYGVKAHDPSTLAAAALLLVAVTGLAGYLPARRATRVDPMIALRDE